jgi:glycosyltransferase involved in cell wall biosynthesis
MPALTRPRVGVDFHTFDGIFQGSRSHLLGLYREVVRQAPEIDFVFLVGDAQRLAAEDEAFRAPNVTCVALPHGGALARLGWQLALAQRRHRLDLLHVQYRGPLWPLGPLACTVHDTLFETHPQFFSPNFVRMARWTGRRAVRQAALLFTVSEFSRREMARLYDLPLERIAVTCNGVDSGRFHPGDEGVEAVRALGLVPGAYLLTVGRLEPRKNHLALIRAYAQLRGPRPPLVVVGQRDFSFQAVYNEVNQLGLQDDVRFLDGVGDGALPALLRHARVFVYPSFAEGFGMPVAEAMASGVAVVTSDGTAMPEVAGDVALLAPPDDPEAIALQIQRLLDEPGLRSQVARHGPHQVAAYRWAASAAVFVTALRHHFEVAGAPPEPR